MSESAVSESVKNFTHDNNLQISKLDNKYIETLESLLSNIRLKPSTFLDLKIIEYIRNNQVKLYNSESTGEFKIYQTSYGISSKKRDKINESLIYPDVGRNYGEDYVYSGNNYISLADGHGNDGERYSSYTGIYLPNYINSSLVKSYLSKGSFKSVMTIIKNAFLDIADNLRELYTCIIKHNNCKFKIIEHIINNYGINKKGGTTYNYTCLHCVDTVDKMKKRYIVHANVGDSETFAVFRYPDGKIRIKQLSTNHSVENLEEAQSIIDRNKDQILSVLPIYGRFNSMDPCGTNKNPLPEPVTPHIDNIANCGTLPIYKIDNDKKLCINGETLHKLNMGLGSYGKLYGIHDWFGGIQGLRTDVLEKKIDGKWVGIAPIPNGIPQNFGSTPNGMTQSTRGFGDTEYNYISAIPAQSIIEVPKEVHVTIISQSDGYGDLLHLSDIAIMIGESIPYGSENMTDTIKENMIKLMYDKIKGNEIKGFSINTDNRPLWDDVSFGIIDSPPME